MKLNIKTTISIIAIALSSITIAEAGERHRGHDAPRHEQSKHVSKHHHFKHHRHMRKEIRAMKRHARWERAYRQGWRKGYYGASYSRHYDYAPRSYGYSYYDAPRYSSHVRVSSDGLPVLAGTLIGSAIANDASGGDPLATFGGAVIGAVIGNQIAQH